MRLTTDDVRIREIKELAPPSHLLRELPVSEKASEITFESRQATHRILHGMDDRLLVVIGPCSIHDTKAAMESAGRLAEQRERLKDDLEIVMRVYLRSRGPPSAGRGSSTTPISTTASRSTRACAPRASCCWRSTSWGCPRAPSSWT